MNTPHPTPNSPLAIGPNRWRVLIPASATAGRLSVMEWEGGEPGGPPLHQHVEQDEVFMVDAGEFIFQRGHERHRLRPGDTIFLPRGVPHTFCQLSERGRLRYFYTPAGSMEAFFAGLAQLDVPPHPPQAAALFEAHGMQVLGPPLQP